MVYNYWNYFKKGRLNEKNTIIKRCNSLRIKTGRDIDRKEERKIKMNGIIKFSNKETAGEILIGLDEKEIKLIKEICKLCEEKKISYKSINKALHLADKVLYAELINRVS